jgi:site-specific DNA-methyltransferase (adenine-specific)
MKKSPSRQQEVERDTISSWRNNMHQSEFVKSLAAVSCVEEAQFMGGSLLLKADCFEWLKRVPENSLHAIVTDPPYGVKEYDADQLQKREEGRGGIWRIPPSFDGHQRSPLPRFTALDRRERQRLVEFFSEWAKLASAALRPGGHLFIATNTFMSQLVYGSLIGENLEFRGEIIRLVQTLRGGDRPKNAEKEFPDVCSMPRGCFEPWGLFRKPLPSRMTVSECLRQFQTGGLRRLPDGNPFKDVIPSEKTPQRERKITDHPSLKPQSFLRQIVYVALPLGEGVLADPFMGSGSTIAAAERLGLHSVGVERDSKFYEMALNGVLKLASFEPDEAETEEIIEGQLKLLEDVAVNGDKSSLPPFSQIRLGSHSP